jgi:hypothetical protein
MKNSKQVLFERMHSIGGMPLSEATLSPDFKKHVQKQEKLIEDTFKRKFGLLYNSGYSRAKMQSDYSLQYELELHVEENDQQEEKSSVRSLNFGISYFNNGRVNEIEPTAGVTEKYFNYLDKVNAGGNTFDIVSSVFINKSELNNEELYTELANIIAEYPQYKDGVAVE